MEEDLTSKFFLLFTFIFFSFPFLYFLSFHPTSEGTPSYSSGEENVKKIQEALASGKLEEVQKHYKEGFRLHHTFKEGDKENCYLSLVLAEDKSGVLKSEYLSVSEDALLRKCGDKANYESLFEKDDYMKQLATNYADNYGFEMKNETLIKAFNDAEGRSGDKDTYKKLREIFGVKAAEGATKAAEDKKAPEEGSKEVKTDKAPETNPEKAPENVVEPPKEGEGA